eukprot:3781677-Pyramimonas_sp.AAC.1
MFFAASRGPTTRAARFPSAFIGALERLVMDEDFARYLRGVARVTPRPDGHAGAARTTGAGRKMPELLLVAPRECCMLDPAWVQTGFDLWQET